MSYIKDYDISYKNVTFKSVQELINLAEGNDDYKHFLDIDYDGNKYRGFCGISFPRYSFDVDKKNEMIELIAKTLRVYD